MTNNIITYYYYYYYYNNYYNNIIKIMTKSMIIERINVLLSIDTCAIHNDRGLSKLSAQVYDDWVAWWTLSLSMPLSQ